jgi:phage host-nuclease inhibitor protein Gam
MSTTVIEDASLMDERLLDRTDEDEGFTVRSEQDVSKAFRAIKAAESKIQQLEEEMDQEIQGIKDFYEPKIRNAKESIDYLEDKIVSFQNSTGDSISTPHGKAYTVNRTKWDWQVDRETLAAWAEQQHPDLVETKKKVSKNDLKSYVKDTWDERHEDDPSVVERKNVESTRVYTQ